jgi:hypothetical protein
VVLSAGITSITNRAWLRNLRTNVASVLASGLFGPPRASGRQAAPISVYQHFQDGTATAADIFQADVNLVLGIHFLPQQFPTLFDDPEARLYAGLAELTIASKILLTETPDFALQQFLIGATAEAVQTLS